MSDATSSHSAEPSVDRPEGETQYGPRCRFLRTKKMFIYDDLFAEPSDPDEVEEDDAIYWCMANGMKNFGPDDEHVNGRDCRRPGRSCYQPH